MNAVRYRPGEAIRWLQLGAEAGADEAKRKGKVAITAYRPTENVNPAASVKKAASAIYDMGKSAYAGLARKRADATEFILEAESMLARQPSGSVAVSYSAIQKLERKGDDLIVKFGDGVLTIKPYAYIVAGRAKAPIGWDRDGAEVPFELLFEEISARSGVPIE